VRLRFECRADFSRLVWPLNLYRLAIGKRLGPTLYITANHAVYLAGLLLRITISEFPRLDIVRHGVGNRGLYVAVQSGQTYGNDVE